MIDSVVFHAVAHGVVKPEIIQSCSLDLLEEGLLLHRLALTKRSALSSVKENNVKFVKLCEKAKQFRPPCLSVEML